jgi:hypothetical protein
MMQRNYGPPVDAEMGGRSDVAVAIRGGDIDSRLHGLEQGLKAIAEKIDRLGDHLSPVLVAGSPTAAAVGAGGSKAGPREVLSPVAENLQQAIEYCADLAQRIDALGGRFRG